uniref:Integrase catalytic domain-containing protein n=1 Tax=Plectus sambesii TaxID=2011161 RepID=A0A914UYU0_9BILA
MDKFCSVNGIDHRVTSAYHPQSNGLTERTNQTIKNGVDKHNEEIDDCRSEARENIVIKQSKQNTTYDAAHVACPFKVVSKVLLHSSHQLMQMAKQLEENFTGPYIIHHLTKANTA